MDNDGTCAKFISFGIQRVAHPGGTNLQLAVICGGLLLFSMVCGGLSFSHTASFLAVTSSPSIPKSTYYRSKILPRER